MDEGSSLEKIAKLVTCAWAMWGNRNESVWEDSISRGRLWYSGQHSI